MSRIDVDVIAMGGKKDLALKAFHDELQKQQALARAFGVADQKKLVDNVADVFGMVEGIVQAIGKGRIRRLRIFGHGSDSTVQIGPFSRTGRRLSDISGPQRIDQADLTKVIMIVKTETQNPDGQVVGTSYDLLNEGYLKKLAGRFDQRGWVELHSCRIVGEDGKQLIKALAMLWKVEVHASEDKQYVGGGLEGTVWVAKPTGEVSPK